MNDVHSARVIGHNALWSMLNQSAGQILALAVFLVTARFVDKDAFGVMAVSMVCIEFFRQITIESVGLSIAAKQNPVKEDYNAAFFMIIAGSILSAAVMFLLAKPAAVFLRDPDIENALQLTCLVLLAMGLARTHETWMAKNMQFKLLAIRSILAYIIGGGVGIYMAVHGYGLLSLIVQQILTSTISMGLLWVASHWRPDFTFRGEYARPLFSYSKHLAMNSFTSVVSAQSDTFFASYYLGSAATGVFNASKRILLATQLMIISGLNSVALPVFASYADDPARLKSAYLKAMSYTTFITAPLYVAFIFLSEDIISIVLGQKWMDTAPVLSILSMSAFIAAVDQYNANIRLVHGKPHWQTYLTALSAVVNIALLVVFARYGLYVMAIALTLKSLLMYPLSLYLSLKLMGARVGEYVSEIYAVIVSALFMGGLVHYIRIVLPDYPAAINLALLVPIGMGVYFAMVFLLDRPLFRQIWHMGLSMVRRT